MYFFPPRLLLNLLIFPSFYCVTQERSIYGYLYISPLLLSCSRDENFILFRSFRHSRRSLLSLWLLVFSSTRLNGKSILVPTPHRELFMFFHDLIFPALSLSSDKIIKHFSLSSSAETCCVLQPRAECL